MEQDKNSVGFRATCNEHQVPEALRDFDSLPNSANVRLPVVKALCGCSAASVWRMAKAGRLPQPKKLSERVTVWNVGDLRKALSA